MHSRAYLALLLPSWVSSLGLLWIQDNILKQKGRSWARRDGSILRQLSTQCEDSGRFLLPIIFIRGNLWNQTSLTCRSWCFSGVWDPMETIFPFSVQSLEMQRFVPFCAKMQSPSETHGKWPFLSVLQLHFIVVDFPQMWSVWLGVFHHFW